MPPRFMKEKVHLINQKCTLCVIITNALNWMFGVGEIQVYMNNMVTWLDKQNEMEITNIMTNDHEINWIIVIYFRTEVITKS